MRVRLARIASRDGGEDAGAEFAFADVFGGGDVDEQDIGAGDAAFVSVVGADFDRFGAGFVDDDEDVVFRFLLANGGSSVVGWGVACCHNLAARGWLESIRRSGWSGL